MKNSLEEQFIAEFCGKIKTEGCSKNTIAEQVFDAGYRLAVPARVNSNDVWIDWAGGECPVESCAVVDVMFRYQETSATDHAGCWRWNHNGTDSDIIAYRLHYPQDANSRANDDRLASDAEQVLREVASSGAAGAVYQKLAYELDGRIGQQQENIRTIRAEMLEVLHDTGLEVKLRVAMKLVDAFIDAGYRKQ